LQQPFFGLKFRRSWKKKYKKELIVLSILLAIGVGLSMTLGFGKQIPNPLDLLTIVFKPLNDLITFLLK
jgi:xanthine/uracil permease